MYVCTSALAISTLIFIYEMLILPGIFTMFSKVIHILNTFTLNNIKNNIKSKLGVGQRLVQVVNSVKSCNMNIYKEHFIYQYWLLGCNAVLWWRNFDISEETSASIIRVIMTGAVDIRWFFLFCFFLFFLSLSSLIAVGDLMPQNPLPLVP